MKKWLYVLSVLFVFVASCNDNVPEPPYPEDGYEGDNYLISLGEETAGLDNGRMTCVIKAESGIVITRECQHVRENNVSNFQLDTGLKDGIYRLLYLEYALSDSLGNGKYTTARYGLGGRIHIDKGSVNMIDTFDSSTMMYGTGTEDDPFIVSASSHLHTIAKITNDSRTNYLLAGKYFRQDADVDMDYECWKCSQEYGWTPIGNNNAVPFQGFYDGNSHKIANLWIKRPNSCTVGLFGSINRSVVKNVWLNNAVVYGEFAVGGVVGAIITRGGYRDCSSIENCRVENSVISGKNPETNEVSGLGVGGAVGVVDILTRANVYQCKNVNTSVSASYNAGGIVGCSALQSNVVISECYNDGSIESMYAGAGGIVATCDTTKITSCQNKGRISGAKLYSGSSEDSGRGVGCIVGGTGVSYITGCVNDGDVSGYDGVGGIIGSTRICGGEGEAYLYNNTTLRYCGNTGSVSGHTIVGGLCGESQFGGYGLYNRGVVYADGDYAGGIVANTSVAVVHNAVNAGNVSGKSYIAGIVGKSTMCAVAIANNYGYVSGDGSHTAGIIGLTGNNSVITYSGNMAKVEGSADGPIGGIVAEIGDPREWSAMNIAECIFGAIEMLNVVGEPVFAKLGKLMINSVEKTEIVLSVVDVCTMIADGVMLGIGINDLVNPHHSEEMNASINESVAQVQSEVVSILRDFRRGSVPSVNYFSNDPFSDYGKNISALTDYYEASDANAESFNAELNISRAERYGTSYYNNQRKRQSEYSKC